MTVPATRYAKISRFDPNGNDITDYLSQLETFFISSPDTGQLQYNIISTQAQSTYFVYGVEPVYVTSSYYRISDYTLYGAYQPLFAVIPGNNGVKVDSYSSVISNPNGYFTASSGIYNFDDTPNIFLTASFTASISMSAGTFCDIDSGIYVYVDRPDGTTLSKQLWNLTGFNSSSFINISASVPLRFTQTGNPYPYSSSIIENSNLYVKIVNTNPGGPSGGNLAVRDFYFNITQSNPPQSSGDPIVVFSPDQIDFFYSDYNPIYGNASDNETSIYRMDVDYSDNPLVPVNFDQLINLTATKAQVQDSNYASQTWSNIRYNGNKSNAQFSILNNGFNAPSEPPQSNQLNSGYGNLSPAEKNESFFAYFEGIGGTGPEIIDQTAYLVKWIIDEQGNVTDPEITLDPFTGLQQNVGVINLTDTFEPGKNANVSLVSNDPLLTSNPNDDSLTGIHPITYVGRIANILITETGSKSADYIRTASFSETIGGVIPSINYNFSAVIPASITIQPDTPTIMNFSVVESDPSNAFSGHTNYYLSPGNTVDDSVQIQFGLRIVVRNESGDVLELNSTFEKSTDGGATWQTLPVTGKYRFVNGNGVWFDPTYYDGNNQWGFNGMRTELSTYNPFAEILMNSPFLDLNTGDRVRVYLNSNHEYRIFGLAAPDGTYTRFSAKMTYNPQLDVTSSYWKVGTYHPAYSRNLTVLTASNQLTQIYNSPVTYYQNIYDGLDTTTNPPTPTSKILNFGFDNVSIPFNNIDGGGPLPGDYIRFEYNPNQVFNIKQIGIVNNPSSSYFGNLTLSVFPPIPSSSNLNHFNIYRIVNDGSSVILDVPKPTAGYSFTGLLYPQFLSKILQASSSAIVQDLSLKGIIS